MFESLLTPKKKQCKIFILDDEKAFLEVTSQYLYRQLQSFYNLEIYTFSVPDKEFYEALERIRPGLFIIDIKLKNLNGSNLSGIELAEVLAKKYSDLIFLFVSGYNYDFDVCLNFDNLCDFVEKPITNWNLFANRVRILLQLAKCEKEDLSDIRIKWKNTLEKDRKMIENFNFGAI